jgi:hypothetical protein
MSERSHFKREVKDKQVKRNSKESREETFSQYVYIHSTNGPKTRESDSDAAVALPKL